MANKPKKTLTHKLNLAGMALSALCIVHCFSVPVIIALFPLLGAELLHNPAIELGLVGSGLLLSGTVVIRDYLKHHHKVTIVLAVLTGFALMMAGILLHGEMHLLEQVLLIGGASIVTAGMYANYKAHKITCAK